MPRNAFSRHREYEDEPRDALTRGEGMIIEMARSALGQVIEELAPDGSNKVALAATAVCGLFADLISGMSTAPGIAEVINAQIRGRGFELVPTRRN